MASDGDFVGDRTVPRAPVTQPDQVLAAFLDGANTWSDVADVLEVSPVHARVVLRRLVKEGAIRWTGRRMPREINAGLGKRIYEVADEQAQRGLDTGKGAAAPRA
jgi:hypothetical protein